VVRSEQLDFSAEGQFNTFLSNLSYLGFNEKLERSQRPDSATCYQLSMHGHDFGEKSEHGRIVESKECLSFNRPS